MGKLSTQSQALRVSAPDPRKSPACLFPYPKCPSPTACFSYTGGASLEEIDDRKSVRPETFGRERVCIFPFLFLLRVFTSPGISRSLSAAQGNYIVEPLRYRSTLRRLGSGLQGDLCSPQGLLGRNLRRAGCFLSDMRMFSEREAWTGMGNMDGRLRYNRYSIFEALPVFVGLYCILWIFCIPKRRRGFSYNCIMFFECRVLRVMEESIHGTSFSDSCL